MSKFKVGDKVTGINPSQFTYRKEYEIEKILNNGYKLAGYHQTWHDEELALVTTKGDKPMARRTFRLLKDLPDVKKGALVQEKCDDGTQEYVLLDNSFVKHEESWRSHDFDIKDYERDAVEQEPTWFVEVFKVTPEYMTQAELDQWEAFKKGQKPAKRKYTRRAKVVKK